MMRLPEAAQRVIDRYDPEIGQYRNPDGSIDYCHTEVEVLSILHNLVKLTRARTIVETGVYYGLSTCFLAAALRDMRCNEGKVYAIDPDRLPHYWDNSDLAPFVHWFPLGSQDALPYIQDIGPIDLLFIDSIHTYAQSSWEVAHFEPFIREGGYIAFHDSLLHSGVGRTVQHLYDSPRFEVITTETPRWFPSDTIAGGRISMGLTLARKIRAGKPIRLDPAWVHVPEHIPEGPEPYIRLHARLASGE